MSTRDPTPPVVAAVSPQPAAGPVGGTAAAGPLNLKWLENFYRECGREVTLAYTTLNQMKNWAIVVAGAILSGLSFSTVAGTYPNKPMFIGVVVAFVFTLRFFIRAILCYINLVRWNVLQNKILALMLGAGESQGATLFHSGDPQFREVTSAIQDLYFGWHSPVPRADQVAANLKLGFSLLFGLCLFFLIWGALSLRHEHLVQGLSFFAVGSTAVELRDFLTSRYFDTKEAYERRSAVRKQKAGVVFPTPRSRSGYLWGWLFILILSLLISFRDAILGSL